MLNKANFRDLIEQIDWDQIKDSNFHPGDPITRELADFILFNCLPEAHKQGYQDSAADLPNMTVLDFYKATKLIGALEGDKDEVEDSFFYGILDDNERKLSDEFTQDGDVNASHFYQLFRKSGDAEANPKRAKLVRMFQEIMKLL